MRAFLFSLLILLACPCVYSPSGGRGGLRAQTTNDLANDICDCLQQENIRDVRTRARNCFQTVTASAKVGEDLFTTLAETCPFLRTLVPENQAKLRWSDIDSSEETRGYRYGSSQKQPLPPTGTHLGDGAVFHHVIGSLQRRPTGNKMVVETETGERIVLEVSDLLLRPRYQVGDRLRVNYRREWRLRSRQIVRVATEIFQK